MEHLRWSVLVLLAFICLNSSSSVLAKGEGEEDELTITTHTEKVDETRRKSKLFPIFQVVTFPNKVCTGTSTRNGTCYTTAECTAKGGTSSGTCAQGYGVCCIFTLSCGGTSSQNCTYLVQASTTKSPGTTCTYTLCKCNSNICRIRLDFTIFQLASPILGLTSQAATTSGAVGGGIGDCSTDSFSLTSPGNTGSPVICGFNTGQHMIVDASDTCSVANFDIGTSGDTRQWDIKVTQYACGDPQGGPEGCLQYFTGTSGRISSYNFPTTSSTIGASTTHLSSQCYTICIRQEVGKCSICYTTAVTSPSTTPAPATSSTETTQTSFGLSVTPAILAIQQADTLCLTDYLVIPNFVATPAATTPIGNRICGRVFTSIAGDAILGASICSSNKPFQITFKTDANEVTPGGATTAAAMPQLNEQSISPGGIVGFSLNYIEQSC